MVSRALAFLERDLIHQTSYKVSSSLELLSVGVSVLVFHFLSKLVDGDVAREAGTAGYFGFVVTGMAVSSMLNGAVRSMASELRQAQLVGTLESVLLTPAQPWEVATWGSLAHMLRNLVRVLLFVSVGFALGLPLASANWLAAALTLITSMLALTPFGVAAAAYVVLFKRGDPISYLVASSSSLLAGVYFPSRLLPPSLAHVGEWLPLTHAIRGFRAALLEGADVQAILPHLLILFAFGAALLPVSAAVFVLAINRARRTGSLSRY
jgi:ABC-2 type transport system permease protein